MKVNEKDLGYSIGGPIGKPGGNNKLFFFYAHEYAPRTGGGDTQRFRFPTALERAGDFSQSYGQQRQPVPLHQGPAHQRDVLGDEHGSVLPGGRRGGPDPGGSLVFRPV